MSTTPRTDAAYFRQGATMYDLARESKKLETELADAKLDAEDQAKWALWYLARAEKAEAELAKRDSEYLRGANMVAESASVWQTRAEKAEAELAAANVEIENLIWNLAGCSTIAESGKPTDYSHELARPALHDVNKLAARAEKAEADTARLDWLQSSVSLHVNSIALRGDIRDAIDAAMKEGSK